MKTLLIALTMFMVACSGAPMQETGTNTSTSPGDISLPSTGGSDQNPCGGSQSTSVTVNGYTYVIQEPVLCNASPLPSPGDPAPDRGDPNPWNRSVNPQQVEVSAAQLAR
jgi:hypothetical protein